MSVLERTYALSQQARAYVYDSAIAWFTADWYKSVLTKLSMNAVVLDVGIGTGSALIQHASLLRNQNVHFIGLDIDEAYTNRAKQLIAEHKLSNHIEVRLQSVYDHSDGPYDAVYFSGSFMLMPDPEKALRHVVTLLKPEGVVYFTQTFQLEKSLLLEYVKPLLVYFTTIDFGQVTYEDQFMATVSKAGLQVLFQEVISQHSDRCVKLVAAAPQ